MEFLKRSENCTLQVKEIVFEFFMACSCSTFMVYELEPQMLSGRSDVLNPKDTDYMMYTRRKRYLVTLGQKKEIISCSKLNFWKDAGKDIVQLQGKRIWPSCVSFSAGS